VIIFGRSIGSGPACHLASLRKAHCLILMSAFTSVKDAATDVFGYFSPIARMLVSEMFDNIENIKKC
jgi:abhydrolase domain-containing protein 17